ncbi:MAG: hypothetical protein SF069_15785 [Phycisphaerae bacterium]|nr:hypothetical protein [Phycisphaerae bacterium]
MIAAVPIDQAEILRRLREQLAAGYLSRVEDGADWRGGEVRTGEAAVARSRVRVVRTGWAGVDETLPGGGLACGAVHEWIGVGAEEQGGEGIAQRRDRAQSRDRAPRRRDWAPPLGLVMHLALRAIVPLPALSPLQGGGSSSLSSEIWSDGAVGARRVVWIGPNVWPYPVALGGYSRRLLESSLFLCNLRAEDRLFAAVLVLRSRGAAAVVVDGSGFDLTATRRLQHAAECGQAICLMLRPPWNQDMTSAARTRWCVRAAASADRNRQRWIAELLRCKGLPPSRSESGRRWTLERDHATGDVVVAAHLGDRFSAAPATAGGGRAG